MKFPLYPLPLYPDRWSGQIQKDEFSSCLHGDISVSEGWTPVVSIKNTVYKCEYCAGYTKELRCPSCGAPIKIKHTYCTTS